MNPPMVDGLYLFPESDDPRFVGVSTISSITTEEEGPRATWPRCFYKYSSQSFLNPIDIALQLAPNWVVGGHKLAAIHSPLRIISLSIQMIPCWVDFALVLGALYSQTRHGYLHCHRISRFPNQISGFPYL